MVQYVGMHDVLFVFGVLLCFTGIGVVYWPAALVVAGLALIWYAIEEPTTHDR